MICIDGREKSGSGTLVRTSLALAALLGEPLRLTHIRAGRPQPGLKAQHLTAAQAVAQMTGGELRGARLGSLELEFDPEGPPQGGSYGWDIGTAGSTTLLVLTILPLAAFASGPCTFRLTGGLFQDFAPTAFHTQYALLPLLGRMGVRLRMEIIRPGYYPKGGGVLQLDTHPVEKTLHPLPLGRRGKDLELWGISLSSHLEQREVSDRMARSCSECLRKNGWDPVFQILYDHTAFQPGAALALFAEDSQGCVLGADQAGARGRPAESIGETVARSLLQDLRSGATVDRHLADQILPFAALAAGTTELRVPVVTDHVESTLWLARRFLDARIRLEQNQLEVEGAGWTRSPETRQE